MKTIIPATNLAKKIIPGQKYQEGVKYRTSRYCISATCMKGKLLFNTVTGEMVFLEDYPEEDKALAEKMFFVPEDYDEVGYLGDIREIAGLLKKQDGSVNHFTILTTTDCNARCFYCYEMGIRRFSMTETTAQKVVEYIDRKHGNKRVKLSWFGGEPLYNMGVIDTISNGLRICGIEYSSIMTSNGFYLTADAIRHAKDAWNVEMIQITIDGTEKVYNTTKNYINNCDNPFVRVMNNIKAALENGLNIGIRLNMDAKNAEDLFRLIDVLADRFKGYDNLHVHVEPLLEYVGTIHHFNTGEELIKHYWKLTDKLIGLGMYDMSELWHEFRVNRCMADNDSSEVIMPDGKIVKCEHVDDKDAIGSIFSEVRDTDKIDSWKKTIRFSECNKCSLLPLCVSLKKCPRTKDGCPEYVPRIWEEQIKRKMAAAFQEYLNKQ